MDNFTTKGEDLTDYALTLFQGGFKFAHPYLDVTNTNRKIWGAAVASNCFRFNIIV